ncbi:hypothetical protein [Mycoplasmopsis alligatoris]|uniref:Lipoprotein n=1 Tax=Mycoplasmopsis alligatoris A21JP2 TaxID=747682 RepID=D4XVM8_9BACT|nr:hypothetical protein [Mycoplasmopsis alligatoris]EFF41706.1 hypothetical protein MALL_0548 [Mycoplasmopsis alligatoris A21JP2]
MTKKFLLFLSSSLVLAPVIVASCSPKKVEEKKDTTNKTEDKETTNKEEANKVSEAEAKAKSEALVAALELLDGEIALWNAFDDGKLSEDAYKDIVKKSVEELNKLTALKTKTNVTAEEVSAALQASNLRFTQLLKEASAKTKLNTESNGVTRVRSKIDEEVLFWDAFISTLSKNEVYKDIKTKAEAEKTKLTTLQNKTGLTEAEVSTGVAASKAAFIKLKEEASKATKLNSNSEGITRVNGN